MVLLYGKTAYGQEASGWYAQSRGARSQVQERPSGAGAMQHRQEQAASAQTLCDGGRLNMRVRSEERRRWQKRKHARRI